MRDLTRSMMRLGWVMPLFAARQMMHLANPQEWSKSDKGRRAMDAVSDAACSELGDGLRKAYDAGERLQDSTLDMVFGLLQKGRERCPSSSGGCGSWSPWGDGSPADDQEAPNASHHHGGHGAHGGHRAHGNGSATPPAAAFTATDPPSQGWGPMPPHG